MSFFARIRAAAGILRRGAPFDRFLGGLITTSAQARDLVQPMRNSPWVMRAIKHVAGPIAAVRLDFSAGGEPLTDPRLDQFFRAPARRRSGKLSLPDTIEAMTGWLKLKGECFLILDDSLLVPFPSAALPAPFIIAPPDRMSPIEDGELIRGWSYQDARGRRQVLLPEQVIHVAAWNPYDDLRGLAEYDAAAPAASADYAAGQYNLNLMRANGDRGPYISLKNGGMVPEAQRKQILEQLREKRELAARGEFKAVFLTGDMEVQDPAAQVIDEALLHSRLQNRHEVFIAFGVPPTFADLEQSYSIGSQSAWYRLIVDTCMPTGCKIAEAFRLVAERITGTAVEARFDWDDHPVMQAVRAERIATGNTLWNMGLSLDDVSEYLRLDLPSTPTSGISYLPFSVAPAAPTAAPAVDPATDPSLAEVPSADPVQMMCTALALRGRAQQTERCTCCWAPEDVLQRAGANPDWRRHMASRRPAIARTRSWFSRALLSARAATLARISERAELLRAAPAPATRAAAADFIFSLPEWKATLMAGLRGVAKSSLVEAGKQVLQEIGRPDDPWSVPDTKVLEFLSKRENRISGLADAVWQDTKASLDAGISAGETSAQLAQRIRETFGGLDKERAQTIAITETGAAFGFGRQEAMQEAGVSAKRWLTSGLPNVRATHLAAEGQVVPVDQAFSVGGAQLLHPGDPNGPAAEVINCHCVSVAEIPEE